MPRRPPIDTRPSWRDPNLPCIRDYRMGNGEIRTEIDPNYEHRYREYLLESTNHISWRNDPTYDLKKGKRKL